MTSAVQAAIERAWRRIEPLALYPRPLDLTRVRVHSTPWLFRLPWFGRFDGYTIWSTILLRGPIERLDDELLTHELVHVWQGRFYRLDAHLDRFAASMVRYSLHIARSLNHALSSTSL